ncbi:hypothetical protein NECAME_18923, partial [Necator americanus]
MRVTQTVAVHVTQTTLHGPPSRPRPQPTPYPYSQSRPRLLCRSRTQSYTYFSFEDSSSISSGISENFDDISTDDLSGT